MKLLKWSSLFLVMVLVCGCPQSAPPVQTQSYPDLAQPRNDIKGLDNFAKISDRLYRGEQPTKEGFNELKKMGIKAIVNLRCITSDRASIKGLGFQYVHINVRASHAEDEDVIDFLKVVEDPQNAPVFVHCMHGSDRTGLMVAIYRIMVQGWPQEKALAELPLFGFHEMYQNIRKYIKSLDQAALRAKVAAAPMPKIEIVD